jgi:UDP-2,3-diacylglucosamine pyrophosphatase LpxH
MALSINEIASFLAAGEPSASLKTTVLYHETLQVEADAADEQGCTPIIFVPDLHLMSVDRGSAYGSYFHLNANRKKILLAFLTRLNELRNGAHQELPKLKVYQLGDMHDLWREAEHWWGESATAMLARQFEEHKDLFELFRALNAERFAGNHDRSLRSPEVRAEIANQPISALLPMKQLHPDYHSFLWGSGCRVDVLHSDQVDDAETPWYRRPINPIGARLADHNLDPGLADEWSHEVIPPGTPDDVIQQAGIPLGGSGAQNLLQPTVHFDAPGATADQKKFFDSLRRGETCAIDASDDVWWARRMAVVIGHTHFPRIVVDGPPTTLTLMDCGSWVNQSWLVGEPQNGFWNGQIGVLSGTEAAVLQIGPTYEEMNVP